MLFKHLVCVCTYFGMYVDIRGQHVENSFLPLCVFRRRNSGLQAKSLPGP